MKTLKRTAMIIITTLLLLAIDLANTTDAASATLQELIDGATLETNGLTFFDFSYSPSTGALPASEIDVQTVSHGLQFTASLFANVDEPIIEFDIDFNASAGTGRLFNQAALSSGIDTTGNGEIGLGGVIENDSSSFLANLENSAGGGVLEDFDSTTFSPAEEIFLTYGFALSGGASGTATLSSFTQTFRTVPTPSAATLALLGMSVLLLRRHKAAPNRLA